MQHDYDNINYTGFQFGKYNAVFTDLRINRETLPKEVYAYDVRHSDSGALVTIEEKVLVNHGGTILTVVPVQMPKGRNYYTLRNWTFTSEAISSKEINSWIEKEKGKLATINASYLFNDIINTPNKMPYKISTTPMNADWKDSLIKQNKDVYDCNNAVTAAKMVKLRDTLLSFGGEAVCFPRTEEDLDKILGRGQCWMGDKVDLKKGEPCHCHSNSALLWDVNKDKTTIATGYALSEDGCWRQHSWIIHLKPRQNRVVETTTKRLLYYGFAMTENECEEFYQNNF